MGLILDINMEADLSEWSSTVTDGADLSQHADAAMGGTSGGMKLLIDDQTAIYGDKTFVQFATGVYRFRFYLDPNGLAMGAGNDFQVFRAFSPATSGHSRVILSYASSVYKIAAGVRDDGGTYQDSSAYTISDAAHYIEVLINYASGPAGNDGTLDLWIDGAHQEQVAGVDLDGRAEPDEIRMGATTGLDAGTSGTFFLDELVLRNDNTEIGAVPAGGGIAPHVGYYRQRRAA